MTTWASDGGTQQQNVFRPRVVRWYDNRWFIGVLVNKGENERGYGFLHLVIASDDEIELKKLNSEEEDHMRDVLDKSGLYPYPVKRAACLLLKRRPITNEAKLSLQLAMAVAP